MAKFKIICERCTSTKLSKPSMVTPHYLFYHYSSKYFRHRTKCRKKKKVRQVLNVGNMLKNKENVSRKNDIWRFHNRGNNFKEKVMTITMFFVACKKVPQYPRVLTTLAFRVPYISEFYFGLTSWEIIVWKSIINWQQILSKRGTGLGRGSICTPHISVVSMRTPIFLVHFCSLYLFNFT